jgi:hypothetical protein
MATRYYIYDRAAHVSEVDRPKWTRWVKKGNSASKHNWVGMTQVVTTFPGASKRILLAWRKLWPQLLGQDGMFGTQVYRYASSWTLMAMT